MKNLETHSTACPNQHCFINQFCSPDWFNLLHQNKTVLNFKKDNRIIHKGDQATGVYFIYEGKVKIHTEGIDGKEMIIRLAKTGDIVGHRGFENKIYPFSVTALENTSVCFIEKESFVMALKNNVNLTYNLLLFYLGELKKAEERIKNMAQKRVGERIAETLLYIEEVFGANEEDGMLNIALSRNDIANMAGTAYETVIRTLYYFAEKKIIAIEGHHIKILNRVALQQYSKAENPA